MNAASALRAAGLIRSPAINIRAASMSGSLSARAKLWSSCTVALPMPRRPEYVGGRAVVLFEPGDRRAREILFEAQDVADLGPTPTVDRLIVVADTAQISALLRQQAQP